MEVVWLANHNAHTYFGLQVLGQLPPDLRELCTEDLPVFHLGLYGPDPLIFSLWTKKISDRLHKRWREESLPDLTDAIQTGSPTARSFAAGYILHPGEARNQMAWATSSGVPRRSRGVSSARAALVSWES